MSTTTRATTPEHGTTAGYGRHRRRGEEACPACKAAKTDYERRRYESIGGRPPRDRAKRKPQTYKPRKKVWTQPEPIAFLNHPQRTTEMFTVIAGWVFTCPNCNFASHPYEHPETAELIQREHVYVCPGVPDKPPAPKTSVVVPNRGRLACASIVGYRTANSSMPRK